MSHVDLEALWHTHDVETYHPGQADRCQIVPAIGAPVGKKEEESLFINKICVNLGVTEEAETLERE